MRKIFTLFIFTFLFSTPTKNDFNKLFIEVAQSGSPCVVSIVSEKIDKNPNMFFFGPFDFEDPYQQERKSKSLGSGVIIDAEKGYLLTNNHVIEGAEEIKVILYDKREFNAKIIGADPPSDLAVLQIEANNLSEAKLGNSDNLQIGEWIIAIGSPFGLHLNHTVTSGIISAVGRSDVISKANFENFIQHDAAINPGNSGGALFSLDGNLIGINTAIATDGYSRSNAGVGFAIPINQAKRVMEDLITGGKVSRGYLGVYIEDLEDSKAKALGINNTKGAFVVMIVEDSPADIAGLKEKDVIIALNSKPIENSNQLRNDVSSMRPGDTVVFSTIRNELTQSISVILGERPSDGKESTINPNIKSYDNIGLKINNHKNGVIIIDIDKTSVAYKNNLRKNDIITEIGREQINSIEDYNNAINTYLSGDTIMLRIIKNGQPRYEAFELE
jgi:serine protease Do